MPKYVKTMSPIDSISGMLGKRRDSISQKALICNVRTAPSNTNGGRPYMYFSVRTRDSSVPLTSKQLEWQMRFEEISQQTQERLKDPVHIAADQAAFRAQDKYKSVRSYVWNEVRKTVITQ